MVTWEGANALPRGSAAHEASDNAHRMCHLSVRGAGGGLWREGHILFRAQVSNGGMSTACVASGAL